MKAELKVQTDQKKVEVEVSKFGLHVVVEQADVAQAVFFEGAERLDICLKQGSKVSLRCTLEGAQWLAVKLLPEERDHDFLFHARDGQRYCAWDDLR